jgi:protein kinase
LGNNLGDGSFGSVVKGLNMETGQLVAIKKMKKEYPNWNECVGLGEVKVLTRLHHPNIVQLIELVKKGTQLHFVFEYLSRNVYQMLQEKGKLAHHEVRNIMFQTLQAVAYTHRKGYFHRDLKPENMLELNGTIKVADYGLAREIRAKPPFTEYVSTRWYRAPEVLLRGRNYNSPMDIFALGAIMAELYSGLPLFPGSTERDQLHRILQLLGTPSK